MLVQAKKIFENIKTELVGAVDSVSQTYGFSADFTKQLKDRATHLKEKIGYPDWILNQTLVNQYYSRMVSINDFFNFFAENLFLFLLIHIYASTFVIC